MKRKLRLRDWLWIHYVMFRYLFTGKCPICDQKKVHTTDCEVGDIAI